MARLLVIGGAGRVATMVLPTLVDEHDVRVFDLAAPRMDVDYVIGDVLDPVAVAAAMHGRDTLVFMAMGPMADWGTPAQAAAHLTVATAGLYVALDAAAAAGVGHAVYTSSLSVYDARPDGSRPDDAEPPDAQGFYGLAKRFGEQVCASAVARTAMSAVALRLCYPTPDDQWPPSFDNDVPIHTSARDTAAALLAAIDYRGHGFDAIAISGDGAER